MEWDVLIRKELTVAVEATKWNADTAMQQIREKNYPASIQHYTGKIILITASKPQYLYFCIQICIDK